MYKYSIYTFNISIYFMFSFIALDNWSGQEVPFPLQSIPLSFSIASSIFIPLTNWEIPNKFPGQPLTNSTLSIILFLTSTFISVAHTPDVYK